MNHAVNHTVNHTVALEPDPAVSPPVRQIAPDNSPSIIQMATKLAKQSQFSDGIKLLSLIPSEQSEYQTAQTLSHQWVEEICHRGKDKIQQGQVRQGLAILHSIPPEDRPAEVTNLITQTQTSAGLTHAH